MDSNQKLVGDENVSRPPLGEKFVQGLKSLVSNPVLIGALIGGLFGWLVLGWGLAAVLAVIGGGIGFLARIAEKGCRVPLVLALFNLTFALIIMPTMLFFGASYISISEGIYAAPLYKYSGDLFMFFYCGSIPILTGLSFLILLANKNQMSSNMKVVISIINLISVCVYPFIALITFVM